MVVDLRKLGADESDPSLFADTADRPAVVDSSLGLCSKFKPATAFMPIYPGTRIAVETKGVGVTAAIGLSVYIEGDLVQ